MGLENLVGKIKFDVIDTGKIRGDIYYKGESQDRDGSPILTFSYKFSQGEAEGFSKYDIGDRDFDEAKADKMGTAKLVLDCYLKDELFKISFIKKSENSARVEINHESASKGKSLDEIDNPLSFYLACEMNGISAEDSGNPFMYDEGREEWLKSN